MRDAQDVLNENGIRLRKYETGAHKTTCPQCSSTRHKRSDPCLSVTIEPDGGAVWNCHHCGWSGGGKPQRAERRFTPERKAYRRPTMPAQPERPDTLAAWFAKRGISRQTWEAAGVYRTRHWFPQLSAEADCIAFPYEWRGALRNVKYRDAAKNFAQEKDAEPVLYGADSIRAGEPLVIVEGELDVLAMREAGFTSVVSLPNGAPAKPESSNRRYEPLETHATELEGVAKFIIATDMDAPGDNLANELARRLGKDRCYRVTFPTAGDAPIKDANECLVHHGADVLRECIELAAPWPIVGLYDADAFSEDVLRAYRGEGAQPISTGFEEMDAAFKFLPGQFIAVTGIPNHGKSRWLDQVAVQVAKAEIWKWAVFSPETGTADHIADLCEVYAGRPFHPGPSVRMDESELRTALAWTKENFFFIDTQEHTPTADWILERARAAVLRHGVRGLIIDPYNEIEAGRPAHMTETEFVSQLISKCKRFAKAHDVTIFMVVHPTKINSQGLDKEQMPGLYDMAGSAHWRNKIDAGLVVYRDFAEGHTIVAALKIRRQPTCGQPGAVKYLFLGAERRFVAQPGTFMPLGGKSASEFSTVTAMRPKRQATDYAAQEARQMWKGQ